MSASPCAVALTTSPSVTTAITPDRKGLNDDMITEETAQSAQRPCNIEAWKEAVTVLRPRLDDLPSTNHIVWMPQCWD